MIPLLHWLVLLNPPSAEESEAKVQFTVAWRRSTLFPDKHAVEDDNPENGRMNGGCPIGIGPKMPEGLNESCSDGAKSIELPSTKYGVGLTAASQGHWPKAGSECKGAAHTSESSMKGGSLATKRYIGDRSTVPSTCNVIQRCLRGFQHSKLQATPSSFADKNTCSSGLLHAL